MRRLLVLLGILAVAGALAPAASATRECDGLDICIPVAGPWVAVPAPSGSVRAPRVEYQLNCPRGSIVGGLDAVVSDRAIEVLFLGTLGSPVNPGISTGPSVVFVATYSGTARRPTTFRPHIGCIPTSGGARAPTVLTAVAPQRPAVRRVGTLRVPAGRTETAALSCAAGERLVGSSHAVAFRTRSGPPVSVLAGVSVTRTERGQQVIVRARRTSAVPAQVRVEVQIHAFCAGGRA